MRSEAGTIEGEDQGAVAGITPGGLPMTVRKLLAKRCLHQLTEQWHVVQGTASGFQAGGLEIQRMRGGRGCVRQR